MRSFSILILIGFLITISSCRSDFDFETSTGGLEFSRDTVYLDTVFTDIGSSTYTLKVYNRSDKDISIPTIQLGRGLDSKYRMTIDGLQGNEGKIFNNVEMLAKDSLYIFIETTANIADANPSDFLYTDQILFNPGSNLQTVELVTLIQDAVFLYPQELDEQGTYESIMIGDDSVYGFVLDEADPINGNEYEFTAEKPYVIYGFAAVASGKQLNIAPGARIHFHAESGIIVGSGGSINAVGAHSDDTDLMENEIIFEGDRLEPIFSDVPGQWFGIWLSSGSTGNFQNVTIKNAMVGMLVENNAATVTIKDTQIYDCSNFGILGRNGTINGENVVINSAGVATFAGTLGGSYDFKHCTFNNNWSSSQQFAVVLENFVQTDLGPEIFPLTHASFSNCIIWGSNQVELLLNRAQNSTAANWPATPIFHKCQIKFNNTQLEALDVYGFINDASEILKNGNPDFLNVNNNQLQIGQESDAIGFGDPDISAMVPFDLLDTPRTSSDLGAYKAIVFED